jgi:hypothetical protein
MDATISGLVLLILFVMPFLVSGAIAFIHSHSLLSPLIVLIGMIIGAITIMVSGIAWLQSLHSEWIQSQAVGFIFLPVILPFYAYLGAVAGASLVTILYGHQKHHGLSGWLAVAAMGLTIVVAGLIPAALLMMRSGEADSNQFSIADNEWFFAILPIVITAMGTASAWLSTIFTVWVFSLCRLMR